MNENRQDAVIQKNQENLLSPRHLLVSALCILLLIITVNYSLYAWRVTFPDSAESSYVVYTLQNVVPGAPGSESGQPGNYSAISREPFVVVVGLVTLAYLGTVGILVWGIAKVREPMW
jgi:hypothetical protein